MGLDTTHNCWHGPYTSFHYFRQAVAKAAGIPLPLMEGYYGPGEHDDPLRFAEAPIPEYVEMWRAHLPIKWGSLKPDPLHALLNHSDCEGEIATTDCGPLADRLEELLPLLEGPDSLPHTHRALAKNFITGLRKAAEAGEAVVFH